VVGRRISLEPVLSRVLNGEIGIEYMMRGSVTRPAPDYFTRYTTARLMLIFRPVLRGSAPSRITGAESGIRPIFLRLGILITSPRVSGQRLSTKQGYYPRFRFRWLDVPSARRL
jgi:hypothetical protein